MMNGKGAKEYQEPAIMPTTPQPQGDDTGFPAPEFSDAQHEKQEPGGVDFDLEAAILAAKATTVTATDKRRVTMYLAHEQYKDAAKVAKAIGLDLPTFAARAFMTQVNTALRLLSNP